MSYTKQTWTNNVSVVDENRMNHIENGIYQNSLDIETAQTDIQDLQTESAKKSIITAGASSSVTATTTGDLKIPITRAIEQIGDKFTISNNRIYVGAGVSKVLASGQVYFNLAANRGGALNLYIRKNGSAINGQTNGGYASTSTRNACLSLPPKLISVSQGDYFDWTAYLYNGDVARSDATGNTFLTIEVID